MTQALQKSDRLSELVKQPRYADRFREVLRERAPQFISSLLQIGNSLGDDCEPRSIISSAMIAASLDLPVDRNLGFAWLVPYKQDGQKFAQFQIGWKGIVQLAQRSGQYRNISVPRGINAEAFKGYDSIGIPQIEWNAVDETKPAIGYAFGWRLVNGGESIFYWPVEKIEAHAKRYSQAFRSASNSPWKTHFPEMCKKTVVKNSFSQFGILSIQMQKAIEVDSAVVRDVDHDPEYLDKPQEETQPQSKPAFVKQEEPARRGRPPKNQEPQEQQPAKPEHEPFMEQDAHALLEDALISINVHFSDFVKWCGQRGYAEADTWAGIQDVPRAICMTIVRDAAGLKKLKELYGAAL